MYYLERFYPKKNGKWYLQKVLCGGKYCYYASDGWTSDWPCVYYDGDVAYDNPFIIPKYLKDFIRKHSFQIRTGTL